MNQSKLVSIIVPIYKSERFLHKCVRSILEQTYRNLEIFLVDDGSPDRSGEICDSYAKLDRRIHVIHKENGGVSDARNSALKLITGEYVTFLDGDDWLENDYIEYLMRLVLENNADMALTDSVFTTRDRQQVYSDKTVIYTNEQAVARLLLFVPIGPWNKIYNVDVIRRNKLSFTQKMSGEGLHFSVMNAQCSNKIVEGKRKIYDYRLNNQGSALTDSNVQMGISSLDGIFEIDRALKIRTPLTTFAVDWHKWKNWFYTLRLIIASDTLSVNQSLYKKCIKNVKQEGWSLLLRKDAIKILGVKSWVKTLLKTIFTESIANYLVIKERSSLLDDVRNIENTLR